MKPVPMPDIPRSRSKDPRMRAAGQFGLPCREPARAGPRPCAPTTDCFSPRTPRSFNMSPSRFPASPLPGLGPGTLAAASMAVLHRHRIAQGSVRDLLDRKAPAEVHAYTLKKGLSRTRLSEQLTRRPRIPARSFSVADAYLVTVLNWSMATPQIDFANWPNVKNYLSRLRKRPSVARTLAEELTLFQAEQERHKAA